MNEETEATEVEAEKKTVINPNTDRYVTSKSPSGSKSMNNGDDVAKILDGIPANDLFDVVEQLTGDNLREKYSGLNIGMQRMNLGNRIRGFVNKINAENGKIEFDNAKITADNEDLDEDEQEDIFELNEDPIETLDSLIDPINIRLEKEAEEKAAEKAAKKTEKETEAA